MSTRPGASSGTLVTIEEGRTSDTSALTPPKVTVTPARKPDPEIETGAPLIVVLGATEETASAVGTGVGVWVGWPGCPSQPTCSTAITISADRTRGAPSKRVKSVSAM